MTRMHCRTRSGVEWQFFHTDLGMLNGGQISLWQCGQDAMVSTFHGEGLEARHAHDMAFLQMLGFDVSTLKMECM